MPDYSPRLAQLLTLGLASESKWKGFNYNKLVFTRADIPALSLMIEDEALLTDETTPAGSAVVHACEVLRSIGDPAGVPPLIKLLRRIDEDRFEWVEEFLLPMLVRFGASAIKPSAELLNDPTAGRWARAMAADILGSIGKKNHSHRPEVIEVLVASLKHFEEQNTDTLTSIVAALLDVKAVEHADLLEAVFRSGKVDDEMVGTWQHVREELGLAPKTPIRSPTEAEMLARLEKWNKKLKEDRS